LTGALNRRGYYQQLAGRTGVVDGACHGSAAGAETDLARQIPGVMEPVPEALLSVHSRYTAQFPLLEPPRVNLLNQHKNPNCTEDPLFQYNQQLIDFNGPENLRVGSSILSLATNYLTKGKK
jgi:hypothetical protein